MVTLSRRLLASASFVSKGARVADIGCDHAYTSIYLMQQGIAGSCIAMDVREGPLSKARENIRRYSLEDKIETRLSDGLCKLSIGEADTILISGMGGLLIQKILAGKPEVTKSVEELILQPQSEQELVRRFLHQAGFIIKEETMLCEDGKYYVSIHAVNAGKTPEPYEKKEAYIFGKTLLDRQDPCLLEYLQNRKEKYEGILIELKQQGKTEAHRGYREMKKKLSELENALQWYGEKQSGK